MPSSSALARCTASAPRRRSTVSHPVEAGAQRPQYGEDARSLHSELVAYVGELDLSLGIGRRLLIRHDRRTVDPCIGDHSQPSAPVANFALAASK